MKLLYLIAQYGANHSGNLIHREIGQVAQAYGHDFQVFAFTSRHELQGRTGFAVEENIPVWRAPVAGTLVTDAVNTITTPLFHYSRFVSGAWAIAEFFKAQEKQKSFVPYDLILAEGAYPFGAMVALAAPKQKLVITVAGGDFIDSRATQYGYGRFRIARRLMHYAFQHASAIRVTTPLVQERVRALGAPVEKITRIPRNIAAYCFPPPSPPLEIFRQENRAELVAKYNLSNAHILVAVGRLLPIKGFDILLRALSEIQLRAGETRLLLVGPNRNKYQSELETLARACGVHDKVIFTGEVPHQEMRALLAAADLIAIPSVLEGMNKIAVEGAAVGTPSVVTRTAGIADLMSQANIGEIVEPNDVDALAARISELLNTPARRAEIGVRGVAWAQQFSSRVVGAQLLELCEHVAKAA